MYTAAFRGYWVRDCLSVDHYCASVIQSKFRQFKCRNDYEYDLYRIVLIQALWRGAIAKKRVVDAVANVILLQSWWRGARQRKLMLRSPPTSTAAQTKQADNVQNMVAASIQINKAATLIQTRWRAYWGEISFIRSIVDILIVQTVVRRWMAKRRVRAMRKARKKKMQHQRRNTKFGSPRAIHSGMKNPAFERLAPPDNIIATSPGHREAKSASFSAEQEESAVVREVLHLWKSKFSI